MPIHAIIGVFVKLFVLLTPFFVLSVFVTMTSDRTIRERRSVAWRTALAIWIICVTIYLFGDRIFAYLGITLAAFQAGAGVLLLLSGIELVRGTPVATNGLRRAAESDGGDISVVPLAIPYTVGPGSIGTLLVMGASSGNDWTVRLVDLSGLTIAVLCVGVMLYFSTRLESWLGAKGLNILTKLTGLFLAALAAQLILNALKTLLPAAA